MAAVLEIVPERPFDDGLAAGRELGKAQVLRATRRVLRDRVLRENLGAMGEKALHGYVLKRLDTPPDYGKYPELEDVYPERLDFLRGLAEGAGCSLVQAAAHDYVLYRHEIDAWWRGLNPPRAAGHCSGILLASRDGLLGGQSKESLPLEPRPGGYRHRTPRAYRALRSRQARPARLVVKRPRTGYAESWGVTNECGLGGLGGSSCSTWLDDPIEDTWPIKHVPLLRFARTVRQLEELYRRYTLYNWGRHSEIWGDATGDGMVVEKSFRRVGIRRLEGAPALWCTEGHFQSDEMSAFMRSRRLAYLERMGRHLGAGDLQYAHDCAVRFTHIGELCHEPWGRGLEHMRRILTDHATFPRAVCRHGGPDTDPYDETVTMESSIIDLTGNRVYLRNWIPWKKFPCEVAETVIQYPPRPSGA